MTKPGDFFVGVLDFFAILLPGAILTAILAPRVGHWVFGPLIDAPQGDAARWGAFLACAYFLGHLMFLIGSYIDPLYNKLREWRSPYGNESAYACATLIRDQLIDTGERGALNTYQWSRAVLIASSPLAADDVHRLVADSKFFRSMMIVCVLVAIVLLSEGHTLQGVVALVLVPPCFARYYERRLKSTTQAYLHVITMYRTGLLKAAELPLVPLAEP